MSSLLSLTSLFNCLTMTCLLFCCSEASSGIYEDPDDINGHAAGRTCVHCMLLYFLFTCFFFLSPFRLSVTCVSFVPWGLQGSSLFPGEKSSEVIKPPLVFLLILCYTCSIFMLLFLLYCLLSALSNVLHKRA